MRSCVLIAGCHLSVSAAGLASTCTGQQPQHLVTLTHPPTHGIYRLIRIISLKSRRPGSTPLHSRLFRTDFRSVVWQHHPIWLKHKASHPAHRCTYTGLLQHPPACTRRGDTIWRWVRDNRPVCLRSWPLFKAAETRLIDERRAPLTASFRPCTAASVTVRPTLCLQALSRQPCHSSTDQSLLETIQSRLLSERGDRISLLWLFKYTHLMCYCAEEAAPSQLVRWHSDSGLMGKQPHSLDLSAQAFQGWFGHYETTDKGFIVVWPPLDPFVFHCRACFCPSVLNTSSYVHLSTEVLHHCLHVWSIFIHPDSISC